MSHDWLVKGERIGSSINCPLCKIEMFKTSPFEESYDGVMCLTQGCLMDAVDIPIAAVEAINLLIGARGDNN